jgi:Transaldolase/Fructose-6-phosphate aldolase
MAIDVRLLEHHARRRRQRPGDAGTRPAHLPGRRQRHSRPQCFERSAQCHRQERALADRRLGGFRPLDQDAPDLRRRRRFHGRECRRPQSALRHLRTRHGRDLDAKMLYAQLAISDIQAAAGVMRPVYEKTNRRDSYVSLEVSPYLATDTQGTIEEAQRLWKAVGRPNVMIKVPATPAGIPAIA